VNALPLTAVRDIWREVSRHLEIGESLRGLFDLVAAHAPLDAMVIRRFDQAQSRLDSVAMAGPRCPDSGARTALTSGALHALATWAERRRTSRAGPEAAIPQGMTGPVAVGPLYDEGDRLVGVAVFAGAGAADLDTLDALLEPLATALANDVRAHELARLKEAAEADRSALLARLQRNDISDTVVGGDSGLRDVMRRVEQVARTDAPVLILGETGAGKEVVARAIHARSSRAQGPILRVNCGAIPSELVDSELFGHEKGAFTGAVSTRKGWFERADGGTLFLDELAELPPAAQVRLLRVLQDGTFQRVGGQLTLTVDVRIVAATHRDMHAAVRDGRFRQDLWYRVSVFPIALPSLRERSADIPALAQHFAERAGARLFGVPLVPTREDLVALQAYPWPGNVRELAAVIERAAILGDGRRLAVAAALGVLPLSPAPARDERGAILEALTHSRGRIEGPFGAAAAMDVNANTLRSRMRRLGIDWASYRRRR
jgi:transcriptional regulator with GAF, ATPase, and Fis domain